MLEAVVEGSTCLKYYIGPCFRPDSSRRFLLCGLRLPHVNDTTVALLMVLCISGISMTWGWPVALTAAIVGGIVYDYYFLGPLGFSITAPEYGVALAAFLITAIVTGQLVAHSKRRQLELRLGKRR